ncbi:MAG: hypothetical protein IH610_05720 [Deltaproteobacteria bacterium]|nr:hypothetical protein [Deltaproteobacteria bacterium]
MTKSRSAFSVVIPGLAALIVAAVVPPAVSAASCRLNDPTVLRNIEYRGTYDNAAALKDGVYEGEPFVPGGASRPRVELLEMPPVLHYGKWDARETMIFEREVPR